MAIMKPQLLAGLRVLVLEDVFLIAEAIAEELASYGCDVVGPAPRVASALTLLAAQRLDGALLDMNVNGEMCFPVIAALQAKHIPVILLTGYDSRDVLPPALRDLPRLPKPFDASQLIRLARREFGSAAPA
jgi:CheY-like chemotaxis protein